MAREEPTHVAFADESSYNQGRYRSTALVTLEREDWKPVNARAEALLEESNVSEFKWSKLNDAKYKFAAEKLVDLIVDEALNEKLRLDVVIWDTWDSRHDVQGRDDLKYLGRMYYHLFRATFSHRWPDEASWGLYPDRQSGIDWEELADIVDNSSFGVKATPPAEDSILAGIGRSFNVTEVTPSVSAGYPLVQVADLFAGLAVYSWAHFGTFVKWENQQRGQRLLTGCEGRGLPDVGKTDRFRCPVLAHLETRCKERKLGVSLRSEQGLRTPNHARRLNFWPYTPPARGGYGVGKVVRDCEVRKLPRRVDSQRSSAPLPIRDGQECPPCIAEPTQSRHSPP